jgi:hypothetical protein
MEQVSTSTGRNAPTAGTLMLPTTAPVETQSSSQRKCRPAAPAVPACGWAPCARSRRGASTGVAGLHCVKDDGKAEGTGGREVWSVIDAGDLGEHRGVPANATGAEDEGDVHAGGAPPPARAR